jgi:mycofactocin precursor
MSPKVAPEPHQKAETREVAHRRPVEDPLETPLLPAADLSDLLLSDDLIEDISIDGMCGVY